MSATVTSARLRTREVPCLWVEGNVWCRQRLGHRRVSVVLPVQEHLILVTELLRANLFEFQRFTQASGEAPYFTTARVRLVARQVPPPPLLAPAPPSCRRSRTCAPAPPISPGARSAMRVLWGSMRAICRQAGRLKRRPMLAWLALRCVRAVLAGSGVARVSPQPGPHSRRPEAREHPHQVLQQACSSPSPLPPKLPYFVSPALSCGVCGPASDRFAGII